VQDVQCTRVHRCGKAGGDGRTLCGEYGPFEIIAHGPAPTLLRHWMYDLLGHSVHIRDGHGLGPSMGWVGLGWTDRDFSSVGRRGRTITDVRSRLAASKVEAIEMVR